MAQPGTTLSQGGRGRHVGALDGVRGLAVLLVFFFHYGGGAQSANPVLHAFGVLNKAGWCGVTLFFVLSGFLITGILWDGFGAENWARNFYARRILRIFPLYYAAVAILLLAGAWQHAFRPTVQTAAVFAAFCQNLPWFPAPQKIAAPVYHLWSIAVEEQFYLAWPLLLSCMRTRRQALVLCVGGFLASLLFRALVWRYAAVAEPYLFSCAARGGELAAGAALALLYRGGRWHSVVRAAPFVLGLSLAAFGTTSLFSGSAQLQGPLQTIAGLCAVTAGFTALLAMVIEGRSFFARLFRSRWLQGVGRISYGLYVFHLLIVHWVNLAAARVAHGHSGSGYEAARLVLALVASLLLAALSFRFLERPFLGLKRHFPAPGAALPKAV